MNEKFLSVYDQSELSLSRLQQIRPQILIGFPSVLMLIGRELQQRDGLKWRPRRLFTLAEVLTPGDRRVLKDQWGVEPVDLYGANEVGHIAFQCQRRGGYHVNVDSLHVELLSGGKPVPEGEKGEVVVTSFDLRVMPIVRYRVGDVAMKRAETCPCSCRFPMLDAVAGRTDGFLIGEDGRPFSALEVSLSLKGLRGIKQYRLMQNRTAEVTVEWVRAEAEAHPEAEIRSILQEKLGSKARIDTREVAEIPREKSGKIRTVVSSLPNPFWSQEERE